MDRLSQRAHCLVLMARRMIVGLLLFCGVLAHAQLEHTLMRRLVVFPFAVDNNYRAAAEEAWWQARDELTHDKRFLVASRQFLQQSDAVQSRRSLEPADALLLGKVLDAHALLTGELKGRVLAMRTYDGATGLLLWQRELPLHPSLAVEDQLPGAAKKLVRDFLAACPYQGFLTVDPSYGTAVYEDGGRRLAQVNVGIGSKIAVGDNAQWIALQQRDLAPLFQGGGQMRVLAEGRVVKVQSEIATVEMLRLSPRLTLKEFALVRFPAEAERLQGEFSIRDSIRTTIGSDLISPEIMPMEELKRERKPLITTLSILSSVATFLLLAF